MRGFFLLVVGLVGISTLLFQQRGWTGRGGLALLTLSSPVMIVAGVIVCVRSFFSDARIFSGRTALYTGLVCVVLGGFPWIYTPLLTGRRAGSAASTLLGALIFLVMGLPGVVLAVVGLLTRASGKKEGNNQ